MPRFGGLRYAGRMTLSDLRYNPPKVDGKVSLKHILWKRGRNELLVWLLPGLVDQLLHVPV